MPISSQSFRDLPIAKKLTLFCVIISLVSLVVAMIAIIFYDRYNFEEILKNELVVLASVIGNRSSAAIVFDDLELANNNLKSLSLQKAVVAACIYKVDDNALEPGATTRLATYPNDAVNCPNYAPTNALLIDSANHQYVELVQPILLDSSIIGYIYLRSNTEELQDRQTNYVYVMIIASMFAVFIAFWLSKIFSRWISGPLHALGLTAQSIAEEEDYSRRANKQHNDEVGRVVDSFNLMLDVIEQEDVELRESEEKFRLISASSKVGIFQLDTEGNTVYANDELSHITGLSNNAIIENSWLSVIHKDDKALIENSWRSMLSNNQAININCRLQNGTIKWISGHVGLLTSNDAEVLGYLGTINDITEIKNAQVQLEQMAFYDTLTGLANRRLFRNRLEHVISNLKREGHCLGLILLDLDNFKNVNDSLGHDSGDALLTIIAERLQQCVRASDTVARLGGDEFAIILPGISSSLAASQVAKKIIETLKSSITLNETEIRITASAGIAMAPENSDTAEDLIKNADLALYRAKDQGRNNYQFFTSEMNTQLINHLQLIQDLRLALNAREFHLVYQPQINITDGRLTGFEALIRWQNQERGFVSPLEFIPAAEETGLIIPLGRWVISEACQQLRSMCDSGLIDEDVVMTVNLSVLQFQDDELIHFIQSNLKRYQLKPGQFEVELTETVLMENLEDALKKLEALKALGILISIDDFGTGYSSLGYLKRLPVNIVKVDRSFVMDIPADKEDMEITAAVIAMAHKLNYEVVAEGVETEEQLQFLESCGCDYGQGYYFSRPLPSSELEQFCDEFNLDNIRRASA